MSHLEANLQLLSRRQPELALLLRSASAGRIEVFPSVKGLPTARLRRSDSTVIQIHSRYDPLQEARQRLNKIDLSGADYFVLLGFGLGYTLDALLEQSPPGENSIFVVESDLQILKAAFQARDLRSALSCRHLHFAWPPTGPALAEQWTAFFDPVRAQKNIYVSHPPSLALNPGLYKSAAEVIQGQTYQIYTDINTQVARSQVFLDNFVQNLPYARASPGVAAFAGRLTGVPAVVVSAGPSLDKNIHELRGWEDRVLLLSTDTALKPLLNAGIEPHFVVSGDPTLENYLHLQGASQTGTLVTAEATAYPALFNEYSGRTVACTFENSSLKSLTQLLGNKGSLRVWGSVATMALDFALLLGCNPIIFAGQDLAHSDGRIYCTGLYLEEDWLEGVTGPEEWERRWETLRSGRKTQALEDIFGRLAESTDKLAAYRNWISKELGNHPGTRFINATEGGVLREGVILCSLREALHRFCLERRGLSRLVFTLWTEAPKEASGANDEILRHFREEASNTHRILESGSKLCAEKGGPDPQDLMRRLEGVKESIYSGRYLAPLLDSFNQMGNFTFLRRRARLAQLPSLPSLSGEIQETYGDYFASVRQALKNVEEALDRVAAVLV